MRFQRLLLESEGSTVTVDLHQRLTVVAGVGPLERASLVNELLGGLASSRPGTHLEVVEASGRRLGVLRPATGAADRVIELSTQQDVSVEFMSDDGRVDLLAKLGVDFATAKRKCRMTAADMAAIAREEGVVARLAAHDQELLWAAAERVRRSDDDLKSAVTAIGADPEDAPLVEEIELRHATFESACARLESVRHHGIFIGGACVLGAMPAVALKSLVAFPLLAVAIVTTFLSIVFRRRMERARAAERSALDEAGVESYLAFRLQRVSHVIEGRGDRSGIAAVAAEHQAALEAWTAMAGDVSVDWASDLRERVRAAAVRIRAGIAPATDESYVVEPSALAQALISRLTELRHLTATGTTLPLLLDEPLAGVEPSVKAWMLELIARSSGRPQVIYLTNDPDVAAWARMEAIGGELSIIEPTPEHESFALSL
jgi:hypothetical protein